MMHPHTELRLVSPEVGMGVFATAFIPKGTIVYSADPLEITISRKNPLIENPALNPYIKKYGYVDQKGRYIISWDHAKYVNHSCSPNTISTGYGFEIAIRDIQPGDEITDDYGLLNIESPMSCCCQSPGCRGTIMAEYNLDQIKSWDSQVMEALSDFDTHEQPLQKLLDQKTKRSLDKYITTKKRYKSVTHLIDRSALA